MVPRSTKSGSHRKGMVDEGFGGVSGRSVHNKVRLMLLSEAQRKLQLACREVKMSGNVSRTISDLESPVPWACERGIYARMVHSES